MTLGSVKAQNMSLDANYGDNHAPDWPDTVYLHLFVADPTAGGAEITGGGYAPVAIFNDSVHWPDAMGGLKTNGVAEDLVPSTGPWNAAANFWWLSDSPTQLLPPGSPSVANVGAPGTTNAQYVVTVLNSEGESTPSGIGVTTTGAAVLNGSNYNVVSWSGVPGGTGYNVYKLVGGVFQFLGTTVSTSLDDMGEATTSQAPPLSNTTMTLLDGGPLANPVRVLSASREYLIRTPLKELLPQLDANTFWQIHRGTVVNATCIEAVTRDEAGKLSVSLRGRTEKLPVSRLYIHLFKAM